MDNLKANSDPASATAVDGSSQSPLACAARTGNLESIKNLLANGAKINEADEQQRTALMLAVIGGHLQTVLHLALNGSDLTSRDANGSSALELAIDSSHREVSLALLLISTGKFTKPLRPQLPMRLLQRLQGWVADMGPRGEKPMGAVLGQYVTALEKLDSEASGYSNATGTSPAASTETEALNIAAGLIAALHYAARFGIASLIERSLSVLATFPPLVLSDQRARDGEGHSVVHALILAGQGERCCEFLTNLPAAQASALLDMRDGSGHLAYDPDPNQLQHSPMQPAVAAAAQQVMRLREDMRAVLAKSREGAQHLAPAAAPSSAPAPLIVGGPSPMFPKLAGAPSAAPMLHAPAAAPPLIHQHSNGGRGGKSGRGGAVRSRPLSSSADEGDGSMDISPDSNAAADLLNLAGIASTGAAAGLGAGGVGSIGTARVRPHAGRARVSKPYNRPSGSSTSSRSTDKSNEESMQPPVWLPSGFRWDTGSALPPGRQPGELAGWKPLAGEHKQQQIQMQKQMLNLKEKSVQGLESRGQALAYIETLGRENTERKPIHSAVDDSVIERHTAFKDLTTWGGFRRHHVMEGSDAGSEADPHQHLAELHELQAEEHYQSAQNLQMVLGERAQGMAPLPVVKADVPSADMVRQQMKKNFEEMTALQQRLQVLYDEQAQLQRYLEHGFAASAPGAAPSC